METNQVKNRWMNAGRIIAVLALAMGMFGCPAIDDGKEDSKILGGWRYDDLDPTKGNQPRLNYYVFNEDETFCFATGSFSNPVRILGKYTTSDGKLYLTEVSYNWVDGYGDKQELWEDMVVEYATRTEEGRPVLRIARLYKTSYIDSQYHRSYLKHTMEW